MTEGHNILEVIDESICGQMPAQCFLGKFYMILEIIDNYVICEIVNVPLSTVIIWSYSETL